mgnify:CR=1 FL=1
MRHAWDKLKSEQITGRAGIRRGCLLLSVLCLLCPMGKLTVEAQTIPAFPEPGLILFGTITNVVGGVGTRVTSGTIEWRFQQAGTSTEVVVAGTLTSLNGQYSYLLEAPFQSDDPAFTPSAGKLILHTGGTNFTRTNIVVNGRPATMIYSSSNRFKTFSFGPADRGQVEQVNLQITSAGEPETYEAWSTRFFGIPNADTNADSDNDGMSNLQEFQAGTNPLINDTVTGPLLSVQFANNAATLRWESEPGKIYRVYYTPALPVATNLWIPLPGDVVASSNQAQKVDAGILGVRMRFYRLAKVDVLMPVLSIEHSNGIVFLNWDSQTGKTYRVQYTTNVSQWTTLAGDVIAASNQSQKQDTNAASGQFRFYRIEVLP